MALVPYHPRVPSISSGSSSSRHSSAHSRPSSHTMSPPMSTHSFHPSHYSARSHGSGGSSHSSVSSAQTFGSPCRAGYVPGQPPHDYFYSCKSREEWHRARDYGHGRRVREVTVREQWGSSSRLFDQENWFPEPGWLPEREHSRRLQRRNEADERWENDTVSPADSISQVSSPRHSQVEPRRSDVSEMGSRGYRFSPARLLQNSAVGSGRSSGRTSIANGRQVRVEAPDWA